MSVVPLKTLQDVRLGCLFAKETCEEFEKELALIKRTELGQRKKFGSGGQGKVPSDILVQRMSSVTSGRFNKEIQTIRHKGLCSFRGIRRIIH